MVNLDEIFGGELMSLDREAEDLFRKYVNPNSLRFEDSWLYILQACRNGGGLYKIEGSLFLVTKKEDDSAIVIPSFFTKDKSSLREIISKISSQTELPVILKNVNIEEINELKTHGFDCYGREEVWSHGCKYDDQTFPQRIVDIEDLLGLKGKSYEEVRSGLRKCRLDVPPQSLRFYDLQRDKLDFLNLLEMHEKRLPGTRSAFSIYQDVSKDKNIIPIVFQLDQRIIGASFFDTISRGNLAYVLHLYDPSFPGLSYSLLFESSYFLYHLSYSHINLQGSETEGLDRWKRGFAPKIKIQNTHMIYRI